MGDSPLKKPSYEAVGKENIPEATALPTKVVNIEIKKPIVEVTKKDDKPAVAPSIKAGEASEPLLQENPNRFVLFPIKYHEVCEDASRA